MGVTLSQMQRGCKSGVVSKESPRKAGLKKNKITARQNTKMKLPEDSRRIKLECTCHAENKRATNWNVPPLWRLVQSCTTAASSRGFWCEEVTLPNTVLEDANCRSPELFKEPKVWGGNKVHSYRATLPWAKPCWTHWNMHSSLKTCHQDAENRIVELKGNSNPNLKSWVIIITDLTGSLTTGHTWDLWRVLQIWLPSLWGRRAGSESWLHHCGALRKW